MDVSSTSEYMNGLNIFVHTGFDVDRILPFICIWHYCSCSATEL